MMSGTCFTVTANASSIGTFKETDKKRQIEEIGYKSKKGKRTKKYCTYVNIDAKISNLSVKSWQEKEQEEEKIKVQE